MTTVRLISDSKTIKRRVDNEVPIGKFLQDAANDLDLNCDECFVSIKFNKTTIIPEPIKLLPELSTKAIAQMHDCLTRDIDGFNFELEKFENYVNFFSGIHSEIEEEIFEFITNSIVDASTRADVVRLDSLLQGRINFEYTDIDGVSPLMMAAANGKTNIVEYLISKGAYVGRQSLNGKWTALEAAAGCGHIDIVKLLLKRGAKTDYRDYYTTPLIVAAKNKHADIVELLLDAGARRSCRATPRRGDNGLIYSEQYTGLTAYQFAIGNGHHEIAEMIAKKASR